MPGYSLLLNNSSKCYWSWKVFLKVFSHISIYWNKQFSVIISIIHLRDLSSFYSCDVATICPNAKWFLSKHWVSYIHYISVWKMFSSFIHLANIIWEFILLWVLCWVLAMQPWQGSLTSTHSLVLSLSLTSFKKHSWLLVSWLYPPPYTSIILKATPIPRLFTL